MFQCTESKECVPKHQTCDSIKDCNDGSDEAEICGMLPFMVKCETTPLEPQSLSGCKRQVVTN